MRSCTYLYFSVCIWRGHMHVCCGDTGSLQTQFPLCSKRIVAAERAINVVNNPSYQLRQGPLSPHNIKTHTHTQCQRTQSGVYSSNMGVTSLIRHSLRFQLAFRAAGWLNLLQTNKISAEDVLKWQVKNYGVPVKAAVTFCRRQSKEPIFL